MILHHGTTRVRAEVILATGPDPNYVEPNGYDTAEGFSTARPEGPFGMGDPGIIARGKADKFGEGSPVILELDVPDERSLRTRTTPSTKFVSARDGA